MRFILILAVVAVAVVAGGLVGRLTAPAPACASPAPEPVVEPATEPASVLVPAVVPEPVVEPVAEPAVEPQPEPQPGGEVGAIRTAVRIVSARQAEALEVARHAVAAKAIGKALRASPWPPLQMAGGFVNGVATQVWVAAYADAGLIARDQRVAFVQGYLMGL